MSSSLKSVSPGSARRIIQLQVVTLVWMVVEARVSLSAAWMARSSALLGFGGDSAIIVASNSSYSISRASRITSATSHTSSDICPNSATHADATTHATATTYANSLVSSLAVLASVPLTVITHLRLPVSPVKAGP